MDNVELSEIGVGAEEMLEMMSATMFPEGNVDVFHEYKNGESILKLVDFSKDYHPYLSLYNPKKKRYYGLLQLEEANRINTKDINKIIVDNNVFSCTKETVFPCVVFLNEDDMQCKFINEALEVFSDDYNKKTSVIDIIKNSENKRNEYCVVNFNEENILTVVLGNDEEIKELYTPLLEEVYYEEDNIIVDIFFVGLNMARKVNLKICSAAKEIVIGEKEVVLVENKNVYRFIIDADTIAELENDVYKILAVIDNKEMPLSFKLDTYSSAGVYYAEKKEFFLKIYFDNEAGVILKKSDEYHRYMASIVMAVYNTEKYISEAIESVVNQDLSGIHGLEIMKDTSIFDETLQLILVDDGSEDRAGEICDEYAGKYSWISAIHKENGGVSSARNEGINLAEGKYINFMDSDDMLGANVVIDCLSFLEGNKKNTDIVTFPVELFGDKDEGHWLNYIFKKGERIIDFFDEHDKPVYAVNHTFFKTDPIKNKIYFDTELTIGEDCRFIYDYIFATRMTVGVLDKCVYYYRKRSGADASALEAGIDTEEYYLPFMKKMVLSILDSALKVYGFIPRFVQFAIMAQLKWRFNMDEKGERAISVIGEERFEEYKELIFKALKNIDDDIILSQDKIWGEHKQYLLSKKYGYPAQKIYTEGKIRYFFGNTFLRSADSVFCRLTFVDVQSDCLIIEGINYSYEDGFLTFLLVNGKKINVEKLDGRDKNKYCLGDVCLYGEDFSCEIPLDNISDEYNIYVGITIDEKDILKKDLRFGKFFPLSSKYKKSYYTKLGWNLSYSGNCLKLSSVEKSYKRNPEKEFLDELIKVGEVRSAILRQEVLAQKALRNRGFKDRQLWIISDRTNAGGDNGEALFDYVNKQCDQGIDLFFAINKDSHDYGRLKEKGSVVDHSSDYYLRLYLQADCVISSQVDEYVINPFMSKKGYTSEGFKDILCDIKHVFLQHGVTKDDISGWINKSNKNLKGIVTAANPEYMSMLDSKYEYTEKEIWLTGFPRHDLLYHDESNLITIMPTWRKTLSRITEDDVGVREVTDEFKNSDYFEFYNKLINDEKLITEAERAGYKICFMPHPTLWGDIDLFEIDERVLIFGQGDAYKDILAKSDLVITDYSSVAIDFSYLRKPVVYCQFDADEFFKGEHAYTKGYFDYEKDGFGEVTYDMDSLIKMVIKYIKNGCSLKSKYKKRIDAFFAFNDNNNSKRVYEKLLKVNDLL